MSRLNSFLYHRVYLIHSQGANWIFLEEGAPEGGSPGFFAFFGSLDGPERNKT